MLHNGLCNTQDNAILAAAKEVAWNFYIGCKHVTAGFWAGTDLHLYLKGAAARHAWGAAPAVMLRGLWPCCCLDSPREVLVAEALQSLPSTYEEFRAGGAPPAVAYCSGCVWDASTCSDEEWAKPFEETVVLIVAAAAPREKSDDLPTIKTGITCIANSTTLQTRTAEVAEAWLELWPIYLNTAQEHQLNHGKRLRQNCQHDLAHLDFVQCTAVRCCDQGDASECAARKRNQTPSGLDHNTHACHRRGAHGRTLDSRQTRQPRVECCSHEGQQVFQRVAQPERARCRACRWPSRGHAEVV